MEEKEWKIKVSIVPECELPADERALVEAARAAALQAYAPYSEFRVGAAVLLENDVTVTGNNQENAAYPSGMCAERIALFYAGAQYPSVPVKALAVAAWQNQAFVERISPCGGCRQVLLETEMRSGKPVRILLAGKNEVTVISRAADMLPFGFGSFRT
ncbi:MAG: cytidine deaminase [Parabacteroides sp.]|nr:cytidine deaminase [Parabacteroides sp.]